MFAIGNDELDKLPEAGEEARCPHCKSMHPIEYGEERRVAEDGTITFHETDLLGFVKCDKANKTYLVAMAGRLLHETAS